MKKIVILGAGTAGTMMAHKLTRKLPAKEWQITVIDKKAEHHYQPSFIFLPFQLYGHKSAGPNKRMIRDLLPKGVRFVQDAVAQIDKKKREVTTAKGEKLGYDYMIVATGTHIAPEEIEGMPEGYGKNIHYFYTLDSAMKLQEAMPSFTQGKMIIEVTEYPIKCPVAPIEFACLADYYFRQKGIRDQIEIEVVTSQASIFSKPTASKILTEMFERKNINVTAGFNVSGIDHEKRVISSFEKKQLDYDLLVAIPPNLGEDVLDEAGIGDGAGFVITDPANMKAVKDDHIYALGDATNLATSKAGSVAHFEANVVEYNLLAEIAGKSPLESFDGHAMCYIETGFNKAHLIDFNFTQEPVKGKLPLPLVGPFSLLKETRINHWGKLFFRWYYWNLLLPDRFAFVMDKVLPTKMSRVGKKIG